MAKQCRAATPWRAHAALDVIAILDMPAWAGLLGLIDQFPVMHASISTVRDARTHTISASAFEFIADNRQIVSIPEFLRSLPGLLRLD